MLKKQHSNALRAALSFTASAAVSFAVFLAGGFAVLRLQSSSKPDDNELPAALDNPEFAVLVATEDQAGAINTFVTLEFRPAQKSAFIETVPEREAHLKSRDDTVRGFAERSGLPVAAEAARMITAKNVARYLVIPTAAAGMLCDALGGVIIQENGPLRLYGEQFAERLITGEKPNTLLAALFSQGLSDEDSLSAFSAAIFNSCKTNITAADIMTRKAMLIGVEVY